MTGVCFVLKSTTSEGSITVTSGETCLFFSAGGRKADSLGQNGGQVPDSSDQSITG